MLGPLEIADESGPVELSGPKRRALAALLIVRNGQATPVDRLVDELWGENAGNGARGTVQTYISQLRKAWPVGAILTRGGGYGLAVDPDHVDAERFERATVSAPQMASNERLVALDEALALWRGAPLEEFAGQPWADDAARVLNHHHRTALELRVDALLELGRDSDALAELERLLATHRLNERFWCQRMVALYRSGRQVDALAAYRELRTTLIEELGVEPSPEATALEAQILAHDPALRAIDQLPGGVTTFLLTDIVNSTALWDSNPGEMSTAVAAHERVIDDIVTRHRGRHLKSRGEGDSTFSVFAQASDAIGAAIAIQIAHPARARQPNLRLRIGIHTGEAQLRDGDYFGGTVNRAARIRGLAPAGQIYVSRATHDITADHLPAEIELVETGSHALKGLRRAETIYAVKAPGLDVLSTSTSTRATTAATEPHAFPPRLRVPGAGLRGRSTEVSLILDTIAGDGPALILVGGEPGVGKTSMLAEVASRAHDRGSIVAYGHADEGLGLPYQIWAEALGQLATRLSRDDGERFIGVPGAALARIVPALARPATPHREGADDEGDRYRLMAAALGLIEAVAASHHVVVVLDDLQWADDASIQLLRYLLAAPRSMGVHVLATYRDSETSRALEELVTAAHRDDGSLALTLGGLDEAGMRSLVRALAGSPNAPSGDRVEVVARALQAETSGNPFFATELLRSGVDPTDPASSVPESVRGVVLGRVERLGPECGSTLRTAAVIGQRFDLATLLATTDDGSGDGDEETTLDALDAACRAGLLIELEPETFAFAHALVQHALAGVLGPTRRARAHRRVADAIERLTADTPDARIEELALHRLGAGSDMAKAADACRRAGASAMASLSPAEATRWYREALALHGTPDRDRGEMLLALALAERAAGSGSFRDTLEQAIALARSIGSADLFADAVLAGDRGFFTSAGTTDAPRIHLMREALDELGDGMTERRARLLMALSGELMFSEAADEREQMIAQAVAFGHASGDLEVEHALTAQAAHLLQDPGQVTGRVEYARRALALEVEFGIGEHSVSPTPFLEIGDLESASVVFERTADSAHRFREPGQIWLNTLTSALRSSIDGDPDELERLATASHELGVAAGQTDAVAWYVAQVFYARRMQGRLDEMRPLIEPMAEIMPDIPFIPAALALISIDTGDLDTGRSLVEELPGVGTLRELTWLATMLILAEAVARLRAVTEAGVMIDVLEPYAVQFAVPGIIALGGPVSSYLGALCAAVGRGEDAARYFADAVTRCDLLGISFEAANARILWAESLHHVDPDDDRIRPLVDHATAAADQRGYAGLRRRGEVLLR